MRRTIKTEAEIETLQTAQKLNKQVYEKIVPLVQV